MIFRVVSIVVVLLIGWGFNISASSIADNNPIVSVLAKAEKFLRAQQNIDDVGSLFLKDRAVPGSVEAKDIPLEDAFSRVFDQKYALNHLVVTRTINSVQELESVLQQKNNVFGNYFYHFPDKVQKTLVHRYDDVLIKTLYCDKGSFDGLDLAILLSMRDFTGGYADTHGMIGLLFLEGNKCYNAQELKKDKDLIIASLVDAFKKDTIFSDVYAERIACLYWAGMGHLVKKEWIDKIIQAQRPDGGWANEERIDSSVHTTGLAVLSLQYYFLNKKPYFY